MKDPSDEMRRKEFTIEAANMSRAAVAAKPPSMTQDVPGNRPGSAKWFGLRDQLFTRLRAARGYLFFRMVGCFMLCGGGAWLALFQLQMSDGVVGTLVTAPVWGGWGALAGTLGLASGVVTVLHAALDGIAAGLQRTAARSLRAVAEKTGATVGIDIASLPAAFAEWKKAALGERKLGLLAKAAGLMGGWMLGAVQKQVRANVMKRAGQTKSGKIAVDELQQMLSAGVVSTLTGPFASQLSIVRWVVQAVLTAMVLVTIAAVWLIPAS